MPTNLGGVNYFKMREATEDEVVGRGYGEYYTLSRWSALAITAIQIFQYAPKTYSGTSGLPTCAMVSTR